MLRPYHILLAACILTLIQPVWAEPDGGANKTLTIYLFWREGCPHCEAEQVFLAELQTKYPELQVAKYEVSDKGNQALSEEFAQRYNGSTQYVPVTYIGGKAISGFNNKYLIGRQIENQIIRELDILYNRTTCLPEETDMVCIPVLGCIDPGSVSLLWFTIILGGLDSFNPCAFFVLFFLLSLMVQARSRRRMLLIGGVFVFTSGFIYFIFMAAWLNMFLLLGQMQAITRIAGLVALAVAIINIKDFFWFKQGPTLSIPESAKPKLFERMRGLVKATELSSMLLGTAVLAVAANTYELLCTAGFPVVYTRVLTLNNLPTSEYYLYLALYNTVYVIPLAVIVAGFTWTLGKRKLQEEEGRMLKLLSGFMMLALGLLLVFAPNMLNNVVIAGGILLTAVLCTALVASVDREKRKARAKGKAAT
jgi:thiol-disulfide isomerase/thioredoxin